MDKNPNPQGKGLSPILDGLSRSRAKAPLPPKQIDQVSSELFTSLFVLNASFKFRPVAGQSYWLYFSDGKFKLFGVAPDDWATGQPGQFVGECVLQPDVTWTININEEIADETWFTDYVEEQRQLVEHTLNEAATLEDAMPYYLQKLPYYSRLLAYGVGTSLKESMTRSGINTLGYEEAKGLLTHSPE